MLILRGGLKSTSSSSVTESSISVTARTACTDLLQDGCKPFDVTIQRILLPYYLAHELPLTLQRIFVLQSSSETAQNLQVAHILRSEERRVGKECRSRCGRDHQRKNRHK